MKAGKIIILLALLAAIDLHQLNTRRSYYPPKIAVLFQNKFTQKALIFRKTVFSYARYLFP